MTKPTSRIRISKNTWIYSMGKTILDWPRELETDLRDRSEVLFCGEAQELELKHYRAWSSEYMKYQPKENRSMLNIYQVNLQRIGDPKYIMIVKFR